MDTAGCAWPMATDNLFTYEFHRPGSCEANLVLWIAFGAVDIAIKLLMAAMLFRLWHRRKGAHNLKGRLPVVPAFGVMGVITHSLFWILVGLNLVQRGTAAILMGLMWLDFVVPWIIYCLKFVRLGLRAASSPVKKWKVLKEDNRLAHMDSLGRFLFACLILCTFGTVLTQCILSPILFDNPWVMLTGIAFNGVFFLAVLAFMGEHISRLKTAIFQSMQDNLSTMSLAAKHDFRMVLNRLNTQLLIMMSFCIPFSILFLLFTARVVAFHYWVVGLCWIASSTSMLLQTTTNFLFGAARRRGRSDSGKPATRESQVALGSVTLASGGQTSRSSLPGPTSRDSLVNDSPGGTLAPLAS